MGCALLQVMEQSTGVGGWNGAADGGALAGPELRVHRIARESIGKELRRRAVASTDGKLR